MASEEHQTAVAPDLEQRIREFIYFVTHNEFTDPEHMLVCVEWYNLCDAVGEPMRMAGSAVKP